MTSLTRKQEKFCQKLIETGNASEAYRQAYDASDMAVETIANEAYKLQQNPEIAARIEKLEALALKRHEVTVDRVISEYAKLAFLDIRKAFDEDGKLLPIHDLDDDTAAAISSIEVETVYEGKGADREMIGRLHKLKLSDKKAALDSLGKYLGIFVDKVSVDVHNIPVADEDKQMLADYVSKAE